MPPFETKPIVAPEIGASSRKPPTPQERIARASTPADKPLTTEEPAPSPTTTEAPAAPGFEPAYTAPEAAEPNYKAPKEHYQNAARTVKGRAIARLLRDSNVTAEKAGTWKLGGPELQKAAASAGVNPPTSAESLAVMLDELRKMPPKGTPEFAQGGIVAPKKQRWHRSRRGVLYGPTGRGAAPPMQPRSQGGMPPEPK